MASHMVQAIKRRSSTRIGLRNSVAASKQAVSDDLAPNAMTESRSGPTPRRTERRGSSKAATKSFRETKSKPKALSSKRSVAAKLEPAETRQNPREDDELDTTRLGSHQTDRVVDGPEDLDTATFVPGILQETSSVSSLTRFEPEPGEAADATEEAPTHIQHENIIPTDITAGPVEDGPPDAELDQINTDVLPDEHEPDEQKRLTRETRRVSKPPVRYGSSAAAAVFTDEDESVGDADRSSQGENASACTLLACLKVRYTASESSKAPRKRKAQDSPKDLGAPPRKRGRPPKAERSRTLPVGTGSKRQSTPTALPSPPESQPELVGNTKQSPDLRLLEVSRALSDRQPLESKPEPRGKPEVWATGRQELCETVPYFKSHHGGCYAHGGTVYSFMFDGAGQPREYMDEDVIIARMGGKMEYEGKSGQMFQAKDHEITEMQPQSVLNNIAQHNPLIVICGNKNTNALTKMPQRYCVLDWFKATHVWAEKVMGKGRKAYTVIKYRFERLDRSKGSWYAPACSTITESQREMIPPLDFYACGTCGRKSPIAYLIGGMCLSPNCEKLWKLESGESAPYGDLDYHPAFLRHEVRWENEDAPFPVNPGVPGLDQYFGQNLQYVNTRGVVCPRCGRCNSRYRFAGWQCDTTGCDWTLTPSSDQVVMQQNLHHTPWDIVSNGPGLTRTVAKPAVTMQVRYSHNYKVTRYTFPGTEGSITHAKASRKVVEEQGGPNDMFRELQLKDIGLERRTFRGDNKADKDVTIAEDVEEPEADAGARMTAFSMNYGMPYKFIAKGDSRSFEDAEWPVRACLSRLNWAQRTFLNVPDVEEEFNELLALAYLELQKIKYHDDGEEGLGPRIATLSLGAAAIMPIRIKAKYFGNVSNTGIMTDEKPLPLALLESSGYVSGSKPKAATGSGARASRDTYEGRLAAHEELQRLKANGDRRAFLARSKELAKELDLKKRLAEPLLSIHLTHGDILIMDGEDVQKFFEHQVEPHGNLRYALTCRRILPHHLGEGELPAYEVGADTYGYDGSQIKQAGDRDAIAW